MVYAQSRAQPAQLGQPLPCVVDDRHQWPQIGRIYVHPLQRTQFSDVTDRAISARHEDPARPVKVVPLRLILAIAIEDLDAMVLAVRHVDPAVSVAGDVVGDIELPRICPRAAPE